MSAARLATEIETLEAVAEGARLEECGRVSHGGNCDNEMREVDREDLAVYLLAGDDLEHVEEYRRAVRDSAYLWEVERWTS